MAFALSVLFQWQAPDAPTLPTRGLTVPRIIHGELVSSSNGILRQYIGE